MKTRSQSEPASSAEGQLILVDSHNACIGHSKKLTCHLNEGILHRAFSVLLFNTHGELLLQKRSQKKMLWPGYWSNSCCSHPVKGENIISAAQRRTIEELGLKTSLSPIYEFQYHAKYLDIGAEHEFCSVLVGISDQEPKACPEEASELCYIGVEKLDNRIKNEPEQFTPWFTMEWQTLRSRYWSQIEPLIARRLAG